MMQRDINITIKLEELDKFSIRIPMSEEQRAREAQRIVNHLYNSWKEKFDNLSALELMGRIAFHLARKFEELNAGMDTVAAEIDNTEKELDRILLATGHD